MSLEEHLGPGEEVKSEYGNLYATNERIVDYTSKVFKERLDDISYDNITSVNVIREGEWMIPISGIVILMIGIFVGSGFVSVLGVLLIFFGSLYRKGHYLIKSRSRDSVVVCKHRYFKWLWLSKKNKADSFVDTVKKFS